MHGEDLVVGVRSHQVRLWRQQLQPNEPSQRSANKEEEGDRDQIKNCDPLMVASQQPAQNPIFLGKEVGLRNPGRGLVGKTDNCAAHCFTVPCPAGDCPTGCCLPPAALPSLSGNKPGVFSVCSTR